MENIMYLCYLADRHQTAGYVTLDSCAEGPKCSALLIVLQNYYYLLILPDIFVESASEETVPFTDNKCNNDDTDNTQEDHHLLNETK